ncbi:MAG: hypothetical protein JWL81_1119 [Verrucomicrobiales bacterium]|nr:hypothetical protein [Verrucomicrobiales bacterium]
MLCKTEAAGATCKVAVLWARPAKRTATLEVAPEHRQFREYPNRKSRKSRVRYAVGCFRGHRQPLNLKGCGMTAWPKSLYLCGIVMIRPGWWSWGEKGSRRLGVRSPLAAGLPPAHCGRWPRGKKRPPPVPHPPRNPPAPVRPRPTRPMLRPRERVLALSWAAFRIGAPWNMPPRS